MVRDTTPPSSEPSPVVTTTAGSSPSTWQSLHVMPCSRRLPSGVSKKISRRTFFFGDEARRPKGRSSPTSFTRSSRDGSRTFRTVSLFIIRASPYQKRPSRERYSAACTCSPGALFSRSRSTDAGTVGCKRMRYSRTAPAFEPGSTSASCHR